jgi:hypothetical protein
VNACSLGDKWFELFYPRIQEILKFDRARDELSRDLLSDLLSKKETDSLNKVQKFIHGNQVVMFGAGPSLESDLAGLRDFIEEKHPTVVAADGAADALYDQEIKPAIIVSDLDSCSWSSLNKNSHYGHVFVHAHGDNMNLVEDLVPKLGSNVSGTTQVTPSKNAMNYGGLTDGDRACYITCNFEPSSLIIAGMDFGNLEGRYSINKHSSEANPSRSAKLSLGKESLEFLIRSRPDIRFLNVTKFGEAIHGATKVRYPNIT